MIDWVGQIKKKTGIVEILRVISAIYASGEFLGCACWSQPVLNVRVLTWGLLAPTAVFLCWIRT